ncbi:MAG TPA: GNAT family N-acetyltransferase [Egibacteraceae bacterium]|nr:GNAT family N-acetyltransferase [Egibacteraceae bacterium]
MTVIQSLRPSDLDEVALQIARLQEDPEHHVGYLSLGAEAIAEELAALPGGPAAAIVAVGGGRPVGLLAAEHSDDPPRVWWHGPFVWAGAEWRAVADRLYTSARRRLPRHVREEELNPDDRSVRLADFAHAHGFQPERASAVLVLEQPAAVAGGGDAVAATDADVADLARLHDDLFPASPTPGARLLATDHPDRTVLVVRRAGRLAGYVVVERQAEDQGYIDFVGVRPDLRRRGIGRTLVAGGVAWLHKRGCTTVSLTVRETLRAARALYESTGFVEERVLRPWRKGFAVHPAEEG